MISASHLTGAKIGLSITNHLAATSKTNITTM